MNKKGLWLALAALLLALSAWLMSRGDKEKSTVRPQAVDFPRNAKPEEQIRNSKRRTLPPLPMASADAEGFRTKRDPMLVALPVDPKRSAMVFELEALKESPIMQIWLDCMLSRNSREKLDMARFKERFGIDPLEDVERMAVSSEKVVLMQGSFGHARFDPEVWKQRSYGEKGIVYENLDSGRVVATWGPDMMIASGTPDSAESVEDAIDRLESTDPQQKTVFNDYNAYGDVYGVLSPEDLSGMLSPDQAALAEKIRAVVQRVDIHVDASDDVAMVADVAGPATEDLTDLSKSFGAALAVGRIKAKSDGDEKLAELLDYAKVRPTGGRFSVDMALPIDLLKDLGPCRKSRRPPQDNPDDDEPEP